MFKKLGIGAAVAVAGLGLAMPTTAWAEPREHHEQRFRHQNFHYSYGPRFSGGIYFGPPLVPYYGPYGYGYYDQ